MTTYERCLFKVSNSALYHNTESYLIKLLRIGYKLKIYFKERSKPLNSSLQYVE